MYLKSIFQNKNFINILFFILILAAIFSFLFSCKNFSQFFEIPILGKINSNIIVNIEAPEKNLKQIHFFVDNYPLINYKIFQKNTYSIYKIKNSDAKTLYFKVDNKDYINSIKNITVFMGENIYYYTNSDIKNFKTSVDNKYFLPSDIKYYKNSKYPTDKGFLHKFTICFLAIFYNSEYFVLPLLCLLLAFLIYENNKEKFSFNFNFVKQNAIWLILLLALVFRIQDNGFAFWGDELYTTSVASAVTKPWIAIFQDPGNPPFFYFVAKIWMLLFGTFETVLRLLPTIFSILTVWFVYKFLEKNVNKNLAILSSFLLAINFYSIQSAQEFRCYALCALLAVMSSYYLFEIIKYKKDKDFIIYAVIAVLMANTHYFQILILLSNFIWAIFVLDNKSRIKFVFANFIAAVSFLPYFLFTALQKALLNKQFNALGVLTFKEFINTYINYYGNLLVTVLLTAFSFVMIFMKNSIIKINNENKLLITIFFYSFYTIIMLFATSWAFSYFVRPIIRNYYFVQIIPYFIILISSVFFLPFKKNVLKFAIFVPLIFLFIFSVSDNKKYINKNASTCIRMAETFRYMNKDRQIFPNKKIGIIIFDFKEYKDFENYKNLFYGDEKFAVYKFGGDILSKINNIDSDIIYFFLDMWQIGNNFEQFNKKYNYSVLSSDKEIQVMRIIKN